MRAAQKHWKWSTQVTMVLPFCILFHYIPPMYGDEEAPIRPLATKVQKSLMSEFLHLEHLSLNGIKFMTTDKSNKFQKIHNHHYWLFLPIPYTVFSVPAMSTNPKSVLYCFTIHGCEIFSEVPSCFYSLPQGWHQSDHRRQNRMHLPSFHNVAKLPLSLLLTPNTHLLAQLSFI